MKPARETSAIFGLRYLEEEDLEINDIIGCQTVAAGPNGVAGDAPNHELPTYYNTYCDLDDMDYGP